MIFAIQPDRVQPPGNRRISPASQPGDGIVSFAMATTLC